MRSVARDANRADWKSRNLTSAGRVSAAAAAAVAEDAVAAGCSPPKAAEAAAEAAAAAASEVATYLKRMLESQRSPWQITAKWLRGRTMFIWKPRTQFIATNRELLIGLEDNCNVYYNLMRISFNL